MANINFSNSVLPNAVLRLQDVFAGGNTRYAHYANTKSEALKALNTRQSARINDVMMNGKCIGVNITWLRDCAALGGFACETKPTTCAIPAGVSQTSETQLIQPDCYFDEIAEVADNLCNNQYEAEELLSEALASAVRKMDIRMNRYLYAQLMAKAQVNNDPDTIGTVVGTTTQIPANLWTSDILVQLELEAQYNGLNNFMILDSRNLRYQRNLSQYRSLNDHERNQEATFRDYDPRLIFDNPLDIAAVTARKSTFLVDMDMVAFVNRNHYTSTSPVLVDTADNFHTFHVISPVSGVRYDVEYQKVCAGRQESTARYYTHRMLVKFWGGVVFAPAQCDNGTGILEYVQV